MCVQTAYLELLLCLWVIILAPYQPLSGIHGVQRVCDRLQIKVHHVSEEPKLFSAPDLGACLSHNCSMLGTRCSLSCATLQ